MKIKIQKLFTNLISFTISTFKTVFFSLKPAFFVTLINLIFIISLGLLIPFFNTKTITALDEIEVLQQQINELSKLKSMSEAASNNLEIEIKNIESRIAQARNGIAAAKKQSAQIEADINQRELDLADSISGLKNLIKEHYILSSSQNFIQVMLSPNDFSAKLHQISYQQKLQQAHHQAIADLSQSIIQLNNDKADLAARQKSLANLSEQLNNQASSFKIDVANAKDYQSQLTTQIAELTAAQTAIINARSGSYATSLGEVALADDFNASIGYKSQAPANSFAVFSFGAYTHRNGMSQYGAKARAESGQTAEEILAAYYPGTTLVKDYNEMSDIKVDGYGTINFENTYLPGLGEMPASWHSEALKAQAVAARTYAIRYTGNGERNICTTESCQVYTGSNKGGAWEQAVKDTARWVLTNSDGSLATTQYASTHGGYGNNVGWDLRGGGDGTGTWTTNAWDNIAKSPWFYKAWYRNGYSKSGNSCGRAHPWLSQEEMSDILNAYIVRQNPNGADVSRIIPITISSCAIGGTSGNPYSMSELRDLANNSGGAVTSISSVSTSHNNKGQTTNVTFQTNRGNISLTGDQFKTIFNLRAPGYLRIPQSSFAFFNIEKS